MMQRSVSIWWIVLLSALLLAGCSSTPEEERLRARMAEMKEHLEQGSTAAFMRGVSEDFTGQDGHFDRRQLELYLRGMTLRQQRIGITVLSAEINVIDERATVITVALATAGSGVLIPDQAETWRVTSGWRLEGGEWKVYNARWDRALR